MVEVDSSELVIDLARRILNLFKDSGATQVEALVGLHVAKRLVSVSGMSLATPGRRDEELRRQERNAQRGSSASG